MLAPGCSLPPPGKEPYLGEYGSGEVKKSRVPSPPNQSMVDEESEIDWHDGEAAGCDGDRVGEARGLEGRRWGFAGEMRERRTTDGREATPRRRNDSGPNDTGRPDGHMRRRRRVRPLDLADDAAAAGRIRGRIRMAARGVWQGTTLF